MRLLIMLVPMLMIGCDGSRESFTLYYDSDGDSCRGLKSYENTNTLALDCSCPTGFTRVGFTSSGLTDGSILEVVCLQD